MNMTTKIAKRKLMKILKMKKKSLSLFSGKKHFESVFSFHSHADFFIEKTEPEHLFPTTIYVHNCYSR